MRACWDQDRVRVRVGARFMFRFRVRGVEVGLLVGMSSTGSHFQYWQSCPVLQYWQSCSVLAVMSS